MSPTLLRKVQLSEALDAFLIIVVGIDRKVGHQCASLGKLSGMISPGDSAGGGRGDDLRSVPKSAQEADY